MRPLNDAPLEFQFRVFARGRRLYVRDEIRRIRYEAETTSLYQDIRPALDEYNRTMMRHILQEAERGGP